MELTASQLHQARFEAVLATQFMMSPMPASLQTPLQSPPPEVVVTLTDVDGRRAPKGYEQYSMIFLGPVEPLFTQGIFKFSHAQLGDTPLFAVPISCDARGAQYEVCVTRTLEEPPAAAPTLG